MIVNTSIFWCSGRWSENLLECEMKKEYYTEVWTIAVNNALDTVYTGRDNEIIVADISEKKVQNKSYVTSSSSLPCENCAYILQDIKLPRSSTSD